MIRYFKKSFVRYLAYGLAIALLSFLFGLFKVNAEMINIPTGNFGINRNYSMPYRFNISANSSINLSVNVGIYVHSYDPLKYTNIVFTFCTTAHNNNLTIKRQYNSGQNCSDSCYNQNVTYFPSGESCPVGSYTGERYYVILPVKQWGIGNGNASTYTVDDLITIKSTVGYAVVNDVEAGYYADNTLIEALMTSSTNNTLNNISGQLNNQTSAIVGAVGGLSSDISGVQSSVDDLKDSVTDSTPPDNLSALSNSAGWLPAGPVDSILSLPLSLLNNLINNMQRTCTPVSLPLPFVNSNLELPCVNSLYAQMGDVSSFINGTVGVIASAFLLFYYLLHLYKYVDDTLTFRENNFIDNWSGV